VIIASIPDIPQCIAALKENMHISAEYSPETGNFVMEGSFEQLACAQVMLQDILKQQQEIQKHQLRRLSSRGYHRHGQEWSEGTWGHHPMTHNWTGSNVYPQQHGPAPTPDSGYHRGVSDEGMQVSISYLEFIPLTTSSSPFSCLFKCHPRHFQMLFQTSCFDV